MCMRSGLNISCIYPFYSIEFSMPFQLRAIKEESKVANHDLANHQACSLLQYINVIANIFIMENYFDELR